jgi:hypothetical protein
MFAEGVRPWKGEQKIKDGSWRWPLDDPFEFVLGGDPYVQPAIEESWPTFPPATCDASQCGVLCSYRWEMQEIIGEMRVGGRVHCLVPPDFGLCVEEKVVYDRPMPLVASERERLVKVHFSAGSFMLGTTIGTSMRARTRACAWC